MERFNSIFLQASGFIIIVLSVAGMEASTTDLALFEGFGIAVLGAMILGCGVLMSKVDCPR